MENQKTPILLYNDECGVCRRIGHWVTKSAKSATGKETISVRPIGDDPEILRSLNPALDIWDAYATIHLVMPDGSMKTGGEAVAEVLRNLPAAAWYASLFNVEILRIRPFQLLLNLAYVVLSDVRPLFGCESCGTPRPWMRTITRMLKWAKEPHGAQARQHAPHLTSRSAAKVKAS